jgi:hypothetical protein
MRQRWLIPGHHAHSMLFNQRGRIDKLAGCSCSAGRPCALLSACGSLVMTRRACIDRSWDRFFRAATEGTCPMGPSITIAKVTRETAWGWCAAFGKSLCYSRARKSLRYSRRGKWWESAESGLGKSWSWGKSRKRMVGLIYSGWLGRNRGGARPSLNTGVAGLVALARSNRGYTL